MTEEFIADKVRRGARISCEEALYLLEEASLPLLGVLATEIKRARSGDKVFYNKNFHIEPTNICVFNCKFCSYRRSLGDVDAWDYSMDEVMTKVERYRDSGVTEVHIVGGVHPENGLYYYADMIRRVRDMLPGVTIKAFSAVELDYMITQAGLSTEEGLKLLKDSGMETMPGGGAEIFDEGIRTKICPQKSSSQRWLEVHRIAHEMGMKTNATMLYGHIESRAHRIEHLNRLRLLQDQTGGFNAFIPLKFRSANNSLSDLGEVSVVEDMRTLAVSRIFLDNFDHIKAYWAMYGRQTTELALSFGADDIDGTIDDTTKIYSMAGESEKPSMSESQMKKLIINAGYVPAERDSFYNEI